MKKILIDANPVVPYLSYGKLSGIGRTCMELIQELDRKRAGLPFDIELYTQNVRGISARALNTGFKCRHVYMRDRWTSWVNRLHLRELVSRYDLLHITHNFERVVDPSRCIVTIHDAMFFSYPEEMFNAEGNRRIVPPFARAAKHIITISENSKRDIVHYMGVEPEKVTVIPWGVDHNMLYPHVVKGNRWSGNKPYFISVSCDTGRKNTISIIRAYEQFVRNNPEHDLILVWRKPSDEALAVSEQSHLRDRIHYASNISNEELADLYAGATASFFPSLYEGFGLPIAESMACGTPCVTCRNSSLEEVGGDAALYVEPYDIDAMTRIMEEFEGGNYNMDDLRARSHRQSQLFTWDKCASATLDVYANALG